jgi:hypothetical protein
MKTPPPARRVHLYLGDNEIDMEKLTTEETTTMATDPTIQITRLRRGDDAHG